MQNKLDYLEEFKKVLANYEISEAGKEILQTTKLALFVGPTSAGRNTLIRELLKTGKYHQIISDTTRAPRVNDGVLERNGVEYWFRSEKDLLADLKAGKFLEAAVIHNQQVSGISLRELRKARDEGRIGINEIEVVGTDHVLRVKPDTYAFFVVPPNFQEWIKRFEGRGQLPAAEKRRRMESAVKEFEAALSHDYYTFVVNDKLEVALEHIHRFVTLDEQNEQQSAFGKQVTEHLLQETRKYLSK